MTKTGIDGGNAVLFVVVSLFVISFVTDTCRYR